MQSFADIIARFGYAELARLLGVPEGTVSSWKSRDVIPSEFWQKVVIEAKAKKLRGVSFDLLARLSAAKRESRAPANGDPAPQKDAAA